MRFTIGRFSFSVFLLVHFCFIAFNPAYSAPAKYYYHPYSNLLGQDSPTADSPLALCQIVRAAYVTHWGNSTTHDYSVDPIDTSALPSKCEFSYSATHRSSGQVSNGRISTNIREGVYCTYGNDVETPEMAGPSYLVSRWNNSSLTAADAPFCVDGCEVVYNDLFFGTDGKQNYNVWIYSADSGKSSRCDFDEYGAVRYCAGPVIVQSLTGSGFVFSGKKCNAALIRNYSAEAASPGSEFKLASGDTVSGGGNSDGNTDNDSGNDGSGAAVVEVDNSGVITSVDLLRERVEVTNAKLDEVSSGVGSVQVAIEQTSDNIAALIEQASQKIEESAESRDSLLRIQNTTISDLLSRYDQISQSQSSQLSSIRSSIEASTQSLSQVGRGISADILSSGASVSSSVTSAIAQMGEGLSASITSSGSSVSSSLSNSISQMGEGLSSDILSSNSDLKNAILSQTDALTDAISSSNDNEPLISSVDDGLDRVSTDLQDVSRAIGDLEDHFTFDAERRNVQSVISDFIQRLKSVPVVESFREVENLVDLSRAECKPIKIKIPVIPLLSMEKPETFTSNIVCDAFNDKTFSSVLEVVMKAFWILIGFRIVMRA